jgi:uncharacterized membrane protein YgcG
MSVWNWILPWRWFSKKKETVAEPVRPSSKVEAPETWPSAPKRNPDNYRGRDYYRSKYYRRGNSFYSSDDDSLVEDIILLTLLMGAFDTEADDIVDEITMDDVAEPETSIEADIAAIDAAVEEVRETYVVPDRLSDYSDIPVERVRTPEPYSAPEPSYSEPESTKTYDGGGSSYDGGGSSYDGGGSSDSGGGSFD